MGKITLSLDDDQEAFVSARIAEGQFGDVGNYLRELVQGDQERQKTTEHLRQVLDEAEASGVCEDTPTASWAEVEQEEARRLNDLRMAIREGIESGVSKRTVEQIWDQARQRHRAKHG